MRHPTDAVGIRYLEYRHWSAIKLGYRVVEVPVSETSPDGRRGYSNIRPIIDWWHLARPALFLALHIRA